MIGTIMNRVADKQISSELTTPDALSLQNLFLEMSKAAVKVVSMEVSSHALSQHRTGSEHFKIALFTNLTQDHLDYHGDMKSYFSAKKKLFDEFLHESGKAVLNVDDPYGQQLLKSLSGSRGISVGKAAGCDYQISEIEKCRDGWGFNLKSKGENLKIETSLIGEFNVYNAALSAVAAIQYGISKEIIQKALKNFSGVPGRLELFKSLLVWRLRLVQIDRHYELSEKARGKYTSSITRVGVRGNIYDGVRVPSPNLLAASKITYDILASPQRMGSRSDEVIDKISRLLEVDRDVLKDRFESGLQEVVVKNQVEPLRAERLQQMKLPGLRYVESSVRFYPKDSLLCHVLGFMSHDGKGVAGIEKVYDETLHPTEGKRLIEASPILKIFI